MKLINVFSFISQLRFEKLFLCLQTPFDAASKSCPATDQGDDGERQTLSVSPVRVHDCISTEACINCNGKGELPERWESPPRKIPEAHFIINFKFVSVNPIVQISNHWNPIEQENERI